MITAEKNRIYNTVVNVPGAYISCFGNGMSISLRIVFAENSDATPDILTLSGRQLSSTRPIDLSALLRLRSDSVFDLSSDPFSDELSRYTQAHASLFPAPYTGKYPLLPVLGPFYHPYFELLCKAGLGQLADHLLEQLLKEPDTSPGTNTDTNTNNGKKFVYPPLGSAGNPREIYGISMQCLRKAQRWSALPEFTSFLKNLRKLYASSPSCADLSQYTRSWVLMVAKHLSVCSDPETGKQRLTLSFFGDISQKQLLRISRYLMGLDEKEPEKDHLSAYMDYCSRCSDLQLWPEGLTPKNLTKAKQKTAEMYNKQAAVSLKDDFTARILSPAYSSLTTKKDEEDPLSPLYDQKYTIRVPLSPSDMNAEASGMRSCLASYIPNVLSGASRILFLRKRCSPDKPFVTLEVSPDGKLLQAKSFANGRLAPSVKKYLTVWALVKGIELGTADIKATA